MSEFENYLTGTLDLQRIHDARNKAVDAGLCLDPPVGCGQIAAAFRDGLSVAEYHITGLCQSCQDQMYSYLAEQEAQAEREELQYYDPNDWRHEYEPPF